MPDKNHHVEFASLHSGAAAPHLTGGGGDGKIDVARNSTLAESEQRLVAEQRMSASTDRETGLTDALVEERRYVLCDSALHCEPSASHPHPRKAEVAMALALCGCVLMGTDSVPISVYVLVELYMIVYYNLA